MSHHQRETVYLGLGSNLPDRRANLEAASRAIEALAGVENFHLSQVYETAPVGPVKQSAFLNAAASLDTTLEPQTLLDRLREIEAQLGRPGLDQRQRWGPRLIDLDILLFGQRIIDQPGLQVPHPRMHERWFVLRPLADLAPHAPHSPHSPHSTHAPDARNGPHLTHPTLGKTIEELLAELDDAS